MGIMDAVLITLFIITWVVCIVIVNVFIYESYKEEHDGITTGQTIVMNTIGILPLFNSDAKKLAIFLSPKAKKVSVSVAWP